MEHASCMTFQEGFPLQFWANAVNTAIYLMNKGPTSALDGGIPEEAWIGKHVKYSFLELLVMKHFSILRKMIEQILKLNDFGYRLWDFENRKIIRSRNVVFNENIM